MTVTIHCFIWRKQRNSYRLYRDDSYRGQRYLAKNLSNSDMLLNMTVHDSCSESDYGPISRSRSSSKATPPVDRAKLKATKHLSDRRATVTCGNGVGSGPDSGDEAKPRPHPRTKSLPSRPVNYYETIDEVRKNALQPVQEGDGDESRSRSLPSLVDACHHPPELPMNRRSSKSCRDKQGRKHKKHKRQSKKRSKNEANTKENVVIDNKEKKRKETNNGSNYENCCNNLKNSEGVYDKLGRECQSHPEIICDVCVTDNGKTRKGRLSLQVDTSVSQSPKKVQFRQRSFSQDQSVVESEIPNPH
ncbi:uncharacterized protein [Amphiura filiformis]|uniref:uncharacterized protein n=1 Tax=Amphiura filiformis TaxID=82378 RepID=UPI003B2127B4